MKKKQEENLREHKLRKQIEELEKEMKKNKAQYLKQHYRPEKKP